jgi:hypothetical protein
MKDIFATMAAIAAELDDGSVPPDLVFGAWRRIAGPSLASHTLPTRFANGVLQIAVRSESWRKQLASLSGQMIGRINADIGSKAVRTLKFEIDEKFENATRDDQHLSPDALRELISQLPDHVRTAADAISDEHLREQFLNAAATSLARGRR